MLKSPLMLKVLMLLGCMALLLLPLFWLGSLINERADYRNDVARSLERSSSGPQKMTGPLIAIPVVELTKVREDNKDVTKEHRFTRYYLPETLQVEGKQQVEPRHIGIYEGQIWHSNLTMQATFDARRLGELNKPQYRLGKPYVALTVGDSRGIGNVGELTVNGAALDVEPGSALEDNGQGVHAALPPEMLKLEQLELRFSLDLSGTGELTLVPLGRDTHFQLTSNWPHPNFSGKFLPEKRSVTPQGFVAHWRSSWFANNLDAAFNGDSQPEMYRMPGFSVTVATPGDQYQLTDRAVKYALLIIALTYMSLFVFETLSGVTLHPMQYLLVGLSLLMFYLLLLALAEHTGFNLAWLIASLACAGLNGCYLQAVLKGWQRSLLFTLGLLALDGVLWQLLRSEDSALLLGAGVLFVALATIMLLTRHIDWYALATKGMTLNMAQEKKATPSEATPAAPQAMPAPDNDEPLRVWK